MKLSKENFFTTSDGAHIFFRQWGSGQPLIFIPGFMCTTEFFKRNVTELAKDYRVICLDQRGHGRSSKTLSGNTITRCAQDVKELIEHLELSDVILAGWSLGGSVAAHYANIFSEYRLAGLVLIEATLFAFSDEPWNTHRCAGYNIDGWNKAVHVWAYNPLQYQTNFCARISNRPLSAEDESWIKEEISSCYSFTGLEFQLDVYHTDNCTPLENRTVPTAIFCADTTAYGGLKAGHEYAFRITKAPVHLYEFYEGGHMLFYFEHEKFNHCMKEFIASVVNH